MTSVNDAPVATPQSVTTAEDTATNITLAATDVDTGDTLTYSIVTSPDPLKGALSGTPPNVTYTPVANFHGTDSFTFKAYDGTDYSTPATVDLTVTSVNDAPVATPQSVTTARDTATNITMSATDVDTGDTLTYSIVTGPTRGSLSSISGAVVTYTPAANYSGADSFTFKANDTHADSNEATVTLTVTAPGTVFMVQ